MISAQKEVNNVGQLSQHKHGLRTCTPSFQPQDDIYRLFNRRKSSCDKSHKGRLYCKSAMPWYSHIASGTKGMHTRFSSLHCANVFLIASMLIGMNIFCWLNNWTGRYWKGQSQRGIYHNIQIIGDMAKQLSILLIRINVIYYWTINPLHSNLPSYLQAERLSPSIVSPSNLQGVEGLVTAIMIVRHVEAIESYNYSTHISRKSSYFDLLPNCETTRACRLRT